MSQRDLFASYQFPTADDHVIYRVEEARTTEFDDSVLPALRKQQMFPTDSSITSTSYPRNSKERIQSPRSSETSSAYSGSDTMQSIRSSLDDPEFPIVCYTSSFGDSDDEDDLEANLECLTVRDTYRECLEKDPNDRTEDDIETLLEFMQHLPAFANMTLSVRRELCAVMVFAVVERAGTVVMNHGEELDSWSVIVNGMVEIILPDGTIHDLYLGDSFGITPTMDKMHHRGTMRTKMDDCQFVCIAQSEYFRILHQGEENTRKLEENGRVILVTEHRVLDGGSRTGHVVIRGTPERLTAQLLDENLLDPGYIEDFLLTHRTFIDNTKEIAELLLLWFRDEKWRDRVIRVVLLWVNNHFTDFEMDSDMMEFIEKFNRNLEESRKFAQMRLLNIACTTKARTRSLTLARSDRGERLQFQLVGGYEAGFDIFVSNVEKSSKAREAGLKRGDQILEANGQSFLNVSQTKALEILQLSTHIQLSVRSNLMGLSEVMKHSGLGKSRQHRKSLVSEHVGDSLPYCNVVQTKELIPQNLDSRSSFESSRSNGLSQTMDKQFEPALLKRGFMTLGSRTKLKKALTKIISKTAADIGSHGAEESSLDGDVSLRNHASSMAITSRSNPDLTSLCLTYDNESEQQCYDTPEHVLRVYRADQTSKYLLVHKETTAREVVMLTLRAYGSMDSSSLYSLSEVTVGEGGLIKQKRLPDQMQNLSAKMELRSRYYLKNNSNQDPLVPDNLAGELLRESYVSFLQLNSAEVAIQITLEDFQIFRQIEPTEYVDDLFEVADSSYGSPMLGKFADLVNREMFWVVTQIVSELNIVRRMRTLKQFIKLARHLREYQNFNSMFAILSGLGHGAVSRLKSTWERLPTKYHKLFQDLQEVMDPSRNMCRYRTLLTRLKPPVIPFYPVVRKDLTFIHYGNDTLVDGLVNFEKLRMISKEVRSLMNMCSQPYVLSVQKNQEPSSSVLAISSSMGNFSSEGRRHKPTRKKSYPSVNPKKMYEDAQMIRRAKAYLSSVRIETDELKLHEMSLSCEAASGQISSQNPQNFGSLKESGSASLSIKSHHPSPTPSTTSSTSLASSVSEGRRKTNPKFGTHSPEAMKKLLALSEGVAKLRHQEKVLSAVFVNSTSSPVTSREPLNISAIRQRKQNLPSKCQSNAATEEVEAPSAEKDHTLMFYV